MVSWLQFFYRHSCGLKNCWPFFIQTFEDPCRGNLFFPFRESLFQGRASLMSLRKEWPPALGRLAGFLGFWVVLDGIDPAGLLIGLGAAAAAAWTSLRLFPPSPGRFRIFPLTLLGLHFIWGSVLAGVDVARRAFAPRILMRQGFVTYACRLPAGTGRELFLAMTSLMPGSLPVEVNDGVVLMHCLDTEQPAASQMADHESRLLKAVRGAATDV